MLNSFDVESLGFLFKATIFKIPSAFSPKFCTKVATSTYFALSLSKNVFVFILLLQTSFAFEADSTKILSVVGKNSSVFFRDGFLSELPSEVFKGKSYFSESSSSCSSSASSVMNWLRMEPWPD